MLRTLWQIRSLLSRREQKRFTLIVAMILVMGLLEAAGVASIFPFLAVLSDPGVVERNALLASIYRFGEFKDTQSFLVALGIGVFLVIVVGLTFKMVTFYAVIRFGHMRAYSMSFRLFRSYFSQSYQWFQSRHTAHLAKNILSEVDDVVRRAVIPSAQLISYSFIALCIIAVLVIADPFVAISAAVVVSTCYASISFFTQRYLLRIGTEYVRANAERFRVTQEAFGGIKYVKLMGLEFEFLQRFQKAAVETASRRSSHDTLSESPRYIIEALLFGGMMVVVIAKLISSGGNLGQSLPVIGLYAFAGARLFPAAQQIYRSVATLRFGHAAMIALIKDMQSLPGVDAIPSPSATSDTEPLRLRRSLELRNVGFSYEGSKRTVIDDLSLVIKANTTVAFVGSTGAGKTTTVDMILGVLDPVRGEMLVDGTRIDGGNVRRWQNTLGYVPQDIFLIDDTIRANVAFGVPPDQIDDGAIERAARMAELHDFVVSELPNGYSTHIGERGIRLSGGQRQRVAIARALYRDPDLLVLDEATSALDSETERAVMDAVRNLAQAKTIIMIAHRLSTVRECDTIYLLDRGKIAASGTYDQLVDQNAKFRALAGHRT